jgi:hypothetical protein
VVIIAKHLCGVATDLAIHSARSFPHIPRGADGKAAILLFCVWTVRRVYTTLLRCTGIEALVQKNGSLIGVHNFCGPQCVTDNAVL